MLFAARLLTGPEPLPGFLPELPQFFLVMNRDLSIKYAHLILLGYLYLQLVLITIAEN